MAPLDRFSAIAFDCDGVLLDSNRIKVDAFRIVAQSVGLTGSDLERFSQWQAGNFGLSRYRVIDELLTGRFGNVSGHLSRGRLVSQFAAEIQLQYPLVSEADCLRDILGNIRERRLFVVSGSDQIELRALFIERALAGYFEEILGSPTPKTENLVGLVDRVRQSDPSAKILMIGDAESDFQAAREAGAEFACVLSWSMVPRRMRRLSEIYQFPTAHNLASLFSKEFPWV